MKDKSHSTVELKTRAEVNVPAWIETNDFLLVFCHGLIQHFVEITELSSAHASQQLIRVIVRLDKSNVCLLQ